MSRYVQTLDPADLDDFEEAVVELLASLFVLVENEPVGRYCFDVLVREAIERGEERRWDDGS